MSNDIKKDKEIDLFNLDQNAAEQAGLIEEWGGRWVLAKKHKREAKRQLDLIRAQVDENIRKNPDMYGIEKITEAVISSKIILSEEYQIAMNQVLEAEYEEDIYSIAFQTIVDRGKMIEVEQRFHAAAYFATSTKVYTEGKAKQVEEMQSNSLDKNERLRKLRKKKEEK